MGFNIKSGFLLFVMVLCSLFVLANFAITDENNNSFHTKIENVRTSETNNILRNLLTARPDLEFSVLGMSSVQGLYEVKVKNGPILFVHESGEYLFQGDLLKVTANEIISTIELKQIEKRRKLFSNRSSENMIIFKPEGESRGIMNVFTDVDCSYCRKFHREVPELNAIGIEVRYLAFPRAGIPSGSYNKIAKDWCAEDQQDTLTRVKNGQTVDVEVCDNNPVAEHYAFGKSIGVTGTPAIILMDGTLIPGYQPAKNYARMLGIAAE